MSSIDVAWDPSRAKQANARKTLVPVRARHGSGSPLPPERDRSAAVHPVISSTLVPNALPIIVTRRA